MAPNTGLVIVGTATLQISPYGSSGEPMPADTVALGASGVATGSLWAALNRV